MAERVLHPLEPVADAGSRVLLLGTMPSPKSREAGFYYAHPQNRFWRVLAALWGEETPVGTQERLAFAGGTTSRCGMCCAPVPSRGRTTAPSGSRR